MALPKPIIHISITMNGALKGFDVDFDLRYGMAAQYHAQACMPVSKTGLEAASDIPEENERDRSSQHQIDSGDERPYRIIVGSQGRLEGILNLCRRMPYSKDIIVPVSGQTPGYCIQYLKAWHDQVIRPGSEKVDLHDSGYSV